MLAFGLLAFGLLAFGLLAFGCEFPENDALLLRFLFLLPAIEFFEPTPLCVLGPLTGGGPLFALFLFPSWDMVALVTCIGVALGAATPFFPFLFPFFFPFFFPFLFPFLFPFFFPELAVLFREVAVLALFPLPSKIEFKRLF